jgi:PleD family two-component response regulator
MQKRGKHSGFHIFSNACKKGGLAIMADDDILKGKKILVVDDEPDVLESLVEILEECDLETASSFESAKELFEKKEFDAAILKRFRH